MPARFQVEPEMGGQRLDLFLAESMERLTGLRGLSRTRIQELIREGRLQIDGKPIAKPNHRLLGGEEILLELPAPEPLELTAEDIMSEGVPELPSDITLKLAAQLMRDKNIRVAYMNHNSAGIIYPAALISYKHLVRHLAAKDGSELKDLGIYAERKSPLEQFIERREEARKQAGLA